MNNIEFTDAPDDIEGFVYVITDKRNDKKYVGKKKFWSVTRKPPLKGKTRTLKTAIQDMSLETGQTQLETQSNFQIS